MVTLWRKFVLEMPHDGAVHLWHPMFLLVPLLFHGIHHVGDRFRLVLVLWLRTQMRAGACHSCVRVWRGRCLAGCLGGQPAKLWSISAAAAAAAELLCDAMQWRWRRLWHPSLPRPFDHDPGHHDGPLLSLLSALRVSLRRLSLLQLQQLRQLQLSWVL